MWQFSGMAEATTLAAWLDFAEKLPPLALSILGEAQIPKTRWGAFDPKVMAAALLIRTVSNFRGALALARARRVIEARVLTRCCIENTFYLAELNANGHAFVKEMYEDLRKSHTTLSELALSDGSTLDVAVKDRLKAQLREINRGAPQAKFLNITGLVHGGLLAKSEGFYRLLSQDAAHPTLKSLNRYVRLVSEVGERELGLDPDPVVNDSELSQTVNWACMGLIGACVVFNEGIGGTPAGQALLPIADQWQALGQT
jgi:hypothetical protein